MTIKASFQLTPEDLNGILDNNDHLPNLAAIAQFDYGLELSWLDDLRIQVEGKMDAITLLVEEWSPDCFQFDSYTNNDEL